MKKLIFRGRSGSIFAKVLYSYILIITLPLIVFGVATYYWLTNAIEKETHKTYSGIAEDIRTEVDRNFQTLDSFAVQLSYMPWAVKLMNMEGSSLSYDRLDIGVLLGILQELRIFQATYPFVDEIAIDFNGKDTIISTVGKDSRERFFSDLIRYKRLTAGDWSDRLSQLNNRTMLLPEEASVLNQSKRLLTYLHALPPGDSVFQATLLLFIKEETIQQLLGKSALVKQNGSVYVTDRQGRYVTGYGGNAAIRAALERQLAQGTSGSVQSMRTEDGTGYAHVQSAEGANGWTYHLVVPDNMLTAKLKSVRLMAIALMMFYLLIGVTVSHLLARRDYRPIEQMLSLVRARLRPAENGSNEYAILQNAIYAMLNDADRSESEILLYKPLARNTCLSKLLKHESDHVDYAETARTMELLDISFPHEYYRCLVMLLDEGQLNPEALLEQLKPELDQRLVAMYWVELDGRSKALILNADSGEAEEEAVGLLREGLRGASVAYRAIGAGRQYRSLVELHLSYAEALRALEYRFIQEDGAILYAERFSDTHEWKGTIGEEEELKLAIRNGNAASAVEMAHRVVRTELQASRLPLGGIRFLCYRVATCALAALEELNIARTPSVSPNELLQQEEPGTMLDTIRRLYEEAARLAAEERQSRNDHLIREIRTYLEQHYTDQNLSLTSVADTFGISPSYLSRYFKSQTGTNFVDYVNRRRIEASKRLLTGETTIVQVAQKVGFDNDITFRRLFKKYMGITPSQYKGNP
ncbi:helix-turn-helix domain-containing protein [Paenibacillus doosanensis]|uniref:helix-turn-helix domain-containing protein n=1 Tax=Paenibacillus doosanensis TaxID=1229154 RepID=UPI00217F8AD2|nr:helix-turn-helix domain-containing protein [Paenibacillus doosanensis]MCS7461330.1 helix-turn-helix domain-containing protein [Paenibacillus doosanensis]